MLGLHGFDAGWAGPVTDGLDRVLRAPLDPQDPSLTLSGVARGDRVNELEFYLPAGLLTPHGLARVFAAHRGPTVPDALIEALEGLGFRPSRGFLKGFVDLVFQAGGRYFIVDWKSNHLGARIGDYGPEALQRAVDDHLYGLQYHLYAAALHRHLSTRLPDYDYDQHFGGVFYLFLRGVEPTAPGSGVHRARPTRALVEALCAYLAGEEGP
jgi:exodeoxyribonuclease V beta subunit